MYGESQLSESQILMSALSQKLSENLDNLTGVKGCLGVSNYEIGENYFTLKVDLSSHCFASNFAFLSIAQYLLIVAAIVLGYYWASTSMFPAENFKDSKHPSGADLGEHDEQPEPPRNFTLSQLLHFDGKKDEKTNQNRPIYLSLNGIVFDVSKGRDFYGPGGPYEKVRHLGSRFPVQCLQSYPNLAGRLFSLSQFAGHECGAALAKMSFDTEWLDDLKGCSTLNFGERTELDNWIMKFRDYRGYPVLGKLVVELPDPDRVLNDADLKVFDGSGEIPEGYAAAPIYIGADDKVFDMSFGGNTFYGPGGPYNKFAGRKASRALALMSLDDANLENSTTADCTEKQLKTMNDWITTFSERKGYPVVGRLQK